MKRQLERTRLFIGSWYTGAGNLKSVFTRRPSQPFEYVREIYGQELERFKKTKKDHDLTFKELTDEEKAHIRERAESEIRRNYVRSAVIILVSCIIVAGITYGINHYFAWFFYK